MEGDLTGLFIWQIKLNTYYARQNSKWKKSSLPGTPLTEQNVVSVSLHSSGNYQNKNVHDVLWEPRIKHLSGGVSKNFTESIRTIKGWIH